MVDGLKKVIAIVATAVFAVATSAPALASNWSERLASASSAEATADPLPASPARVSAACESATSSNVTVSWTAVGLATSYSILESTKSGDGPYKVVVTGIAGTSWTGSKLASGNYWFEVRAWVGANWAGAPSVSTVETTVVKNKSCVQP